MPRSRKLPQKTAKNEVHELPKAKSKTKQALAKKQKLDHDWMEGEGATVINILLSVQKTDCNKIKSIAELTKLYKKVNQIFSKFLFC